MTPPILLASHNPHKHDEIVRALGVSPDQIVLPADLRPGAPDPVEDAPTYRGNAVIKASELSRWSGLPALADDTGLEVEALGGRPGVLSARYSGPDASYADNVTKLLEELSGVPEDLRRARFLTVLVLCDGDEVLYETEGICEGVITFDRRGNEGFGYDPVFLPDGDSRTLAELAPAEKDRISHRGRALARLREDLTLGRFPVPLSLEPR